MTTSSRRPASSMDVLAHTTPAPRRVDDALFGRWEHALTDWKAPERVHDALRRLRDPDSLVVVTGQQPGFLGGPLYGLYKAATAVALAEQLEAATGRPALAVFWAQGDDTDWDEVAWVTLPQDDASLFRHRWEMSPEPRTWVGNAAVDMPPGLGEQVPSAPGAPVLPRDGVSLSDQFIGTLLETFGRRGLLPLDSRWPELRRAGAPLWNAYLDRRTGLSAAVLERGRELRARGHAAPIDEEGSDHGLFVLDEFRRLPIEPERWEAQARAALEADPGILAPSVFTRAPLQDFLFGPVSQVVGATEAAYLDQLQPVYDALALRAPVRTPRLRMTVFPTGLVPEGERAAAVDDPEAWVAARAEADIPGDLRAALERLTGDWESGLDAVRETANRWGGDLDQLADATRRKGDGLVKKLRDTVDRRARQKLYRREPRLRHLPEFLAPRRKPQERGISGAALWGWFGEGAPDRVLDEAHAHLDRVADGGVAAALLEADHG